MNPRILRLARQVHPFRPALARRQGVTEDSNQDTLMGTVDLVTIQRAFAANVDSLKALDSILGTVVNQVGQVE